MTLIWWFSSTSSENKVPISADALRMRCRRLCEKKPSGKYNIDEATALAYKEGGSQRELLEMALLECLSRHGTSRDAYRKIKAHSWIFSRDHTPILYIMNSRNYKWNHL